MMNNTRKFSVLFLSLLSLSKYFNKFRYLYFIIFNVAYYARNKIYVSTTNIYP